MSRTKDMVMDLMEADDSFDGEGWLRQINGQEKAGLPPPKADNGIGFAPSSEPNMTRKPSWQKSPKCSPAAT